MAQSRNTLRRLANIKFVSGGTIVAVLAIVVTILIAFEVIGGESFSLVGLKPTEITIKEEDADFNITGAKFDSNTIVTLESTGFDPVRLESVFNTTEELTVTASRSRLRQAFGGLQESEAKGFTVCVKEGVDKEPICLERELTIQLFPEPRLASSTTPSPQAASTSTPISAPTATPTPTGEPQAKPTPTPPLGVVATPTLPPPSPTEVEPNGTLDEATQVESGRWITGELSPDDTLDFFVIVVPQSRGRLSFEGRSLGDKTITATMYGHNGKPVSSKLFTPTADIGFSGGFAIGESKLGRYSLSIQADSLSKKLDYTIKFELGSVNEEENGAYDAGDSFGDAVEVVGLIGGGIEDLDEADYYKVHADADTVILFSPLEYSHFKLVLLNADDDQDIICIEDRIDGSDDGASETNAEPVIIRFSGVATDVKCAAAAIRGEGEYVFGVLMQDPNVLGGGQYKLSLGR